jgi:hypothetical protein
MDESEIIYRDDCPVAINMRCSCTSLDRRASIVL